MENKALRPTAQKMLDVLMSRPGQFIPSRELMEITGIKNKPELTRQSRHLINVGYTVETSHHAEQGGYRIVVESASNYVEAPPELTDRPDQEIFTDIAFSSGNTGNSGNAIADTNNNSNLQDSGPLPTCYQEAVTLVTVGTFTGSVDGIAVLHLDDLRKSGLSNETILVAGIKSIRPCDIAKQIGYDAPEVMSAYSIPFDENFSRVKAFYAPDAPSPQKRKRPKYYQKKGTGNRLYIPPMLSSKILMGKEPIYIAEGEKKALCACQNGFPAVGITGLWNWKRPGTDELIADFDRINLKGRKIILVPDSDHRDPNKNLTNAVERLTRALQLKAAEVWVLQLPHSEDQKTGLDDFIVQHGADAFQKLPKHLMDKAPCFRVEHGELRYYPIKEEWEIDANGKRTDEKITIYQNPVKIASAIEIVARTRNGNQGNWGCLIRWKDQDRHLHEWAVPMELFSGNGEAVRQHLLHNGCYVTPFDKYRPLLNVYLQTTEPDHDKRVTCSDMTGWHENLFVTPNNRIGSSEELVLYQGTAEAVAATAGTLEGWQDTTAKYCIGNSRLLLAVCAGLAAPLLHVCGLEGGGIHFKGPSSLGKTTTLYVGGSVWGGHEYKGQWRATVNGLEGIAAAHNDLLLVLDELSEAEPKDAGATAYMLANGQGKGRANRNGDIRQRKRWRLLFLSSGEISLSDHLRSDGRKVKAGQEVRLIDLPADTGLHGVFENLHGYADGAGLAREIYQSTATDYGHAGIEFVRKVSGSRQEAQDVVGRMTKAIQARLPQGVDGQVVRVADRFALLAAAGELATRWGITGWPEGEALRGVGACLNAWLESRGGYNRHEETEIISQVKRFFEAHGMARFYNADHPDERTIPNMAGYRRDTGEGWAYYVYPETFKQEVCNGLNLSAVCKLLSDKGLMVPGSDRTSGLHRFNGRQQRFYHITAAVTD